MTTTLRNFVFVVIAMIALVLPADALFFSLRAGTTLTSYLEGSTRSKLADLTWKTVAQGKWQASFDATLAFSAPKRDEMILRNARWQRKMIGLAAWLFGYDAYPTYYGSTHCRIASWGGIVVLPRKYTTKLIDNFISHVKRYGNIMKSHHKIGCFYTMTDQPQFSSSGPFKNLVTNPVLYPHYYQAIRENLPKTCTAIDLGYKEDENILSDFFRTDHHWSMQGALRAYNRIAAALGIVPVEFTPPVPVTAEEFWGSRARGARDADVVGDAIFDVDYKRSPLVVKVNGKVVPESFLDYGYKKIPYKKRAKFDSMYSGGWFHAAQILIHMHNKNVEKGTLLIVGNSFGHCMERFFAESYRDVYKMDPRFPNFWEQLKEFLDRHAVDDVLFHF